MGQLSMQHQRPNLGGCPHIFADNEFLCSKSKCLHGCTTALNTVVIFLTTAIPPPQERPSTMTVLWPHTLFDAKISTGRSNTSLLSLGRVSPMRRAACADVQAFHTQQMLMQLCNCCALKKRTYCSQNITQIEFLVKTMYEKKYIYNTVFTAVDASIILEHLNFSCNNEQC